MRLPATPVRPSATDEIAPIAASSPIGPTYELVDLDRYAVLLDSPVGYIDVVPPLFVCHLGHPYARAVEIAQMHDFHRAIDSIIEAVASS